MNKIGKIILVFLLLLLMVIMAMIISFNMSMKPDKEKEVEVRAQANEYLKERFNEKFEIYDTLFDNMGNFEFEYAAKVRDKENQIEFLVYMDNETNVIVDTYVADKWAAELENEVRSYIIDKLGEKAEYFVMFSDTIGVDLGIDPLNVGSYRDYDANAMIHITLPRKKSENDDTLFNHFVSYMENNDLLHSGTVFVGYVAENGVILEEEGWSKDF